MKTRQDSMFFFEKKNQKTFGPLGSVSATATVQMDNSLFASFSSEKEDSSFLSWPRR
jgi:hypothetical protein